MDFPSTDCERKVLKALKIENSAFLPFGILFYIHSACQATLPESIISIHCMRLLSWPIILRKLKLKFPSFIIEPLVETNLREIYLSKGMSPKFLERLLNFLEAIPVSDAAVKVLNANLAENQRKERRKNWDLAMEASKTARNMCFEDELKFDFETSETSVFSAEQLQSLLMQMADEESASRAVQSHGKPTAT